MKLTKEEAELTWNVYKTGLGILLSNTKNDKKKAKEAIDFLPKLAQIIVANTQ